TSRSARTPPRQATTSSRRRQKQEPEKSMTPHILLINPNSSEATSDMMHAIALTSAAGRMAVKTATARRAPGMIVTPGELAASAAEVVELGTAHGRDCAGIIVSAFGDPGLAELRRKVAIPVVGI